MFFIPRAIPRPGSFSCLNPDRKYVFDPIIRAFLYETREVRETQHDTSKTYPQNALFSQKCPKKPLTTPKERVSSFSLESEAKAMKSNSMKHVARTFTLGQNVYCPADRDGPAYHGVVTHIGETVHTDVNGLLFQWITVREQHGERFSHIWPSHRISS